MLLPNSSDTTDGSSPQKKLKLSSTILEKQNKLIFKFRDNLRTLPMNVCKELLEYNKQEIPSSDHGAVC